MPQQTVDISTPADEPVVIIRRQLKAPPELVFAACTDPVQMAGGTLLTGVSRYVSMEARDGHLNAGMESGMRETCERLDELLGSLRAG